jgi:acetyl esterase/lipase
MTAFHALLAGGLLLQAVRPAQAQPQPQPPRVSDDGAAFRHDELMKAIDDLQWQLKLGDIADVDKVSYTSLPPAREPNPTAQGAGNPLIIRAYTFIPKKLDRSKKQPLIVLVHGGVHSNFSSSTAHIVREMVEQG